MDNTIDLPPPSAADSPSKTPSKSRSFSDPPLAPNALQPSPTFREKLHHSTSKDDQAVPLTPRAGRRPDILGRGLSLQMPSPSQFPNRGGANGSGFPRAVPLSPQLDQHNIYMQSQSQSQSPATSIPRHSRGLDFSRACTTLHHSTLAESSPDSSPVITHKAMNIPQRRGSVSSMMLDSPNLNGSNSVPWGSLAPERSTVSSSVGSVNMLGSDDESSDSDEDASMGGDDTEDPIFTTPQVHKLQNPNAPTPFAVPPTTPGGGGVGAGGGSAWGANFSPAQASLMKNFRRSKIQKNGRRSRKSSSSASGSGYSSMNSPRTASPPPMRSIETAGGVNGNGGFNWNTAARSRRESLALGTDGLHLSSGNDSGDEASGNTAPSTPGVVRRAVTRRGNLLPKTKGFARIRAALMEEAAPIDSEVKREAETIRQVRERDGSVGDLDLERPQTATAQSSPSLLPAVPESDQENFGKDLLSESSNFTKGLGVNFAAHASRNSGGMDYWNRFDPSATANRTPPPPNFHRQSSSVLSDAMNTDSDGTTKTDMTNTPLWRRPRARSSASDASEAFAPNSAAMLSQQQQPAGMSDDMHLQHFKKRRREDDFDISTIKRRAVSPGMSQQNSPVLTQSPSQKDGWGGPPARKEGERGGSLSGAAGGGNGGGGGKKLGLQGMSDTHDGLMKMSIE